jgi:hypothetical protein
VSASELNGAAAPTPSDLAVVVALGRVYLGILHMAPARPVRNSLGEAVGEASGGPEALNPALELQVQVGQAQGGLSINHAAVPPCLLTGMMALPLAGLGCVIYLLKDFPRGEADSLRRAFAQGMALGEQLRAAASGVTLAPAGTLGAIDAKLGGRPPGKGRLG